MSVKPVPLEPIAIVGSSCRFAGDATSPSKLWDLLRSPRDVQSKVPDTRYSVEGYYHPDPAHHGHTNVKHAYLLSQDTSVFDAEFFGINGLESRAMDPQQRMLLEVVYESIDDAGMTIEGLRGSNTAVYAGLMSSEYEFMLLKDLDAAPTYLAAGIGRSILSNRISYFFDWHGASMTIDTACSSSLVAVHQAVQSLRAGESTMAVACGANLVLGPESYIIESKVKMLSPKGRCRMWDKDAAGYVRGDGVAAVILKPLNLALKDGDTIHCLIRETGIGQDGATPGLTMPSATAQRELIQSTYLRAGLDPFSSEDQPQYFEAHGTGTPAGDPVECEAIHTAFFGKGKPPARDHPLYCGSIKTILGHTEGTAGIAGILKASLAIKNSVIPPNLLFDNLSPSVAPFYHGLEIRRTARPWPETSKWQPKRASVNSFGFGGTNAHAILESYENPGKCNSQEYHLFTPFVFSAASETSLRANVAAYARYLNEHPDLDVQNLAYTLRQRRSVFAYRTSFPPTSLELLSTNIIARLQNLESPLGVRTSTRSGRSSRILGIFTGQGAQYAQMGAEIIEKSAYAQRLIDELEAYLARLPSEDRPPWSLKDEILRGSSTSRINEAAISQPLCTAIQILIVGLLEQAHIRFHTRGHCLAG
ncbi:Fc.00g037930.m01.CDS01 [Cosmosporella sp. VM-42]